VDNAQLLSTFNLFGEHKNHPITMTVALMKHKANMCKGNECNESYNSRLSVTRVNVKIFVTTVTLPYKACILAEEM